MLERYDLLRSYSRVCDMLGAADLLILCFSTALGTFASSVYVAIRSFSSAQNTLNVAAVGAGVGALLARFVLCFLNYAVGASQKLMAYADGELQSFQPHRLVLKRDLSGVDEDYISGEVERTVQMLKSKNLDTAAAKVEKDGNCITQAMAKWLLDHRQELSFHQGLCWRLFHSDTTFFTCTEYELAALSMMKIESVLIAYLCPEVIAALGWDKTFVIEEVFLPFPHKMVVPNEVVPNEVALLCEADASHDGYNPML